jgi:hypothetical protein
MLHPTRMIIDANHRSRGHASAWRRAGVAGASVSGSAVIQVGAIVTLGQLQCLCPCPCPWRPHLNNTAEHCICNGLVLVRITLGSPFKQKRCRGVSYLVVLWHFARPMHPANYTYAPPDGRITLPFVLPRTYHCLLSSKWSFLQIHLKHRRASTLCQPAGVQRQSR